MMTNEAGFETASANYRAYLIRVWREGEHATWRASATHVMTGETRRFASPQMLWAYLQVQLEAGAQAHAQ